MSKLWWWTVKSREERRIRRMSPDELEQIITDFLNSHWLDPEVHAYIHGIGQKLYDGEEVSYEERRTVLDLMERLHRDPNVRRAERRR